MSIERRLSRLGLCVSALLAGACAKGSVPEAAPLPALPVTQAAPPQELPPRPDPDPLAALPPGELVTLTADNVDVRVLLPALAEAAGISMVLDDAVEGRVSVNLREVPARDALRAVLDEAGLGLAGPPAAPLFPPTVFYSVLVNVEGASAALIRAHFGVSSEMAEWIVRARPR